MNVLEKTIHENGIEILSELLFLAPKFVSGVDRKAELAAGRTEDDEPECFADFYDELEGLTSSRASNG